MDHSENVGKYKAIAYVLIIVLTTLIMMPRWAFSEFGLLDDGVTLDLAPHILEKLSVGNIGYLLQLETYRGRFRPFYWLYYSIQYPLWGRTPFGYFVVQWLNLMFTGIAVYALVEMASRNTVAGLASGVLYVLSPVVVENYFTLSKPEPVLVLSLVLSILLMFKAAEAQSNFTKNAFFCGAALFLALGYLTKETAISMTLISGLWFIGIALRKQASENSILYPMVKRCFLVNVIYIIIVILARTVLEIAPVAKGEYSQYYIFTPDNLSRSLLKHLGWHLRDFGYLFIIMAFLISLRMIQRGQILQRQEKVVLIGSVIWIAGHTLIMLPWHSTLEYFLLPVSLGTAVFGGIGVSIILRYALTNGISVLVRSLSRISLISVLLIGYIALINGGINGFVQIAVDSANAALMRYLASSVPINGVILVNLPEPNEYVLEMGLHLRIMYDRPDIQVRYFGSFDLTGDVDAFIVTPVMVNQLIPSVRIAVYESGAKTWERNLQTYPVEAVHQIILRVQLLTIHLEQVICPVLTWSDTRDPFYCEVKRPFVNTRVFEFGWKIYRVREAVCRSQAGEGWYDLERANQDWWRWTDGRGLLKVFVNQDTSITLSGEIASIQRPNRGGCSGLVGEKVATLNMDDQEWWLPLGPLTLPLKTGGKHH